MRVLLVDPPGVQEGLNVGLGYLSSSLRAAGYDVVVLDLNNSRMPDGEWLKKIARYKPHVVGVSIKSSTYFESENIAGRIKEKFGDVFLVGGGPHVSLTGRDFLSEDHFFDYCVLGEGEESLPRLCDALEGSERISLEGVVSRDDSKADDRPLFVSDLDLISPPEYGSFTNIGETLSKVRYPIVTSRGCPYECIYCSVCYISGRKWRVRSLTNVLDEISSAKKKYGIKAFEILDDNFTLDVERAKDFCRMLVKKKINLAWSCPNGIRTDSIDGELTELMKESRCDLVMVGVESGDDEVFNRIDKGEQLSDVAKGIQTLKKVGIKVGGYFIIGLPGDSIESTKRSVEFAKKNKLDIAHFNMLVPYPKTRMWEWIKKNGIMLADYRLGRHFIGKPMPVFETDDFTGEERIRAYYMANTQLKQFNFILPDSYSRLRRRMKKIELMGRYDKKALVGYLLPARRI